MLSVIKIGHLTNLRVLGCEKNQLKSLPPEIGRLTNLQELDCDDNELDWKTWNAVKKLLERDVLVFMQKKNKGRKRR